MSLANDIVDGSICSYCLLPFTQSHGYPVCCRECWENKITEGGKTQKVPFGEMIDGFQKAIYALQDW